MHTSGKVFAWLIVPLAIGAIYLAARTANTRNAWQDKIQKNEATYKKNKEQIAQKTLELQKKRGDLANAMIGWDRYWSEVPGSITANGTFMSKGVGTAYGIQNDQVLRIFAINADGTSSYIGEFKVFRGNETAFEAKPNWFVREGELNPGEVTARVRTLIPGQYLARLGALQQQMLTREQAIGTNNEQLAKQAELEKKADGEIARRMGEINGNPDLEGKQLPLPLVKGYLAAIASEEETRNAALLEGDRLLRDLKQTRRAFEETLKTNRRLTDSLPKGATEDRTVGATAR